MKHTVHSLLFFVFVCINAFAQKHLTGELSGNYPAGDYIVSGNICVLPKATLSFAAGSTLRFDNFTGIVVRGALVCKGTPGQPVLFTSSEKDVPDAGTAAKPFDWNGIKVTAEAATITLEHCAIAYSTYGLDIESGTTPMTIKNVIFHDNGSASFTRGKKMMQVNENIPLSFNWPETSMAAAGKNTVKEAEKKDLRPKPAWKKTVRIAGISAAIAGGALWLTGYLRAEHYNSLIKPGTTIGQFNEYKDSWNSWVSVRNIGIGLSCLGATGLAVTFVF
jgi:hypothetical protein